MCVSHAIFILVRSISAGAEANHTLYISSTQHAHCKLHGGSYAVFFQIAHWLFRSAEVRCVIPSDCASLFGLCDYNLIYMPVLIIAILDSPLADSQTLDR